ncbi:MAG: FG-GAP repeat domain-containing protein, partial [Gammaproteobacteria bacterium]
RRWGERYPVRGRHGARLLGGVAGQFRIQPLRRRWRYRIPVFAVADYNGDGLADIGWQNGSSIKIWMNGGSGNYSPTVIGSYICCWQPEGGLPSRQP